VTEAEQELEAFAAQWSGRYPSISRFWRSHWANLVAFFDYYPGGDQKNHLHQCHIDQ
jgi:putative transposase